MNEVDLNKYKSAWRTEQSFVEEKLSKIQIQEFMQSASKNISKLFKKSVIIDICIKILLTLSFCVLLILYSSQNSIQLIESVLILVTITGIVIQIKVYKKILDIKIANQNSKSLLYSYVDFYNNKFVISRIITSLSSSLFFVSGAFYYFYYKYGTIRLFEFDDYLVFIAIIAIGFILSAYIHRKNFNFHVHQLEESICEIEQDSLDESKLKNYKKRNTRNLIIYSSIFIIGLFILIVLAFLN